jgi:outer membrane lipoprotein-sorting protein
MHTRWPPRIFVVLAGLALAASAGAQLPDGTAHWKSTIEVQGGPAADVGPMQAEIWVKQGKLRMQTQVIGITQNFVKSGDTMYQWTEGQKNGMKMATAVAGRASASGDYATRIEEYRTKGTNKGSESVDGHACDIFELSSDSPAGARKETVWLARDLHNFPLKVVSEANGSRITSRNSAVSFQASVPDSMLAPPADVEFRDMSEMIRNMK